MWWNSADLFKGFVTVLVFVAVAAIGLWELAWFVARHLRVLWN